MKIAIVKLSAMGDIIHAMVALQYIKKAKPHIQIDWIVEEGFAQVLEHNPHIDNILTVNLKAIKKDKLALFKEIKKVKTYAKNSYDLVIDAQGLLKSAITAKLLGKKVAGFSKNSIREEIASLFYHHPIEIDYASNAIDRNLKVLLEPLDISISKEDILNKSPFLYSPKTKKKGYILFVVGASVKNKIYPKKLFLEVAEGLNRPILVIWSNDKEREVATYLNQLHHVTIADKMNLNELKAVVANATLVIGGDTGPTHMAWGLNIPSITLFGNTPEERNSYITPINRVIKSNSKVNPLKLDNEDFSIQEIEPKTIIKLAKELLNA